MKTVFHKLRALIAKFSLLWTARNFNNSYIRNFAFILPIIIILVVLGTLSWTYLIDNPYYRTRGLILAIPALISSVILFKIQRENLLFDNLKVMMKFDQRSLIFIYLTLQLISFTILITFPDRNIFYFITILITCIIILIQIFSENMNPKILLFEIIFIMLNLTYSVTLKYPFYFGKTDLLSHIYYSQITYLSGNIIPFELDSLYKYFPLFHIFVAESSYVLGLDIKNTIFLVTAPIHSIMIIFVYYIYSQIINNKQVPLLACLLYATNNEIIYSGTAVITRTMAFFGFIIIMYLIYNSDKNPVKFKEISLIFILYVMLVHQVSSIHISLLMLLLLFFGSFVPVKTNLKTSYLLLFITCFVSYWIYVAYRFTVMLINGRAKRSFFSSIVTEENLIYSHSYIPLFEKVDVAIFLFFSLIGIGYALWKAHDKYVSVIALFTLFMLPFYIPSPIYSLWQAVSLFEIQRITLYLSLFMAFIMGYGVWVFYNFTVLKNKHTSIVFILLSLLIFISLISSVPDNRFNEKLIPSAYTYFSDDELTSFQYVLRQVPFGSCIHTDFYASRYFREESEIAKKLKYPYYESKSIRNVDNISTLKGYILLRDSSFLSRGLMITRSDDHHTLYYPDDDNKNNLYANLQRHNKIYSSSAVNLYLT